MDPLQLGQRRLAKKDYDGAIKAFTEAIKISSSHMLLPALQGRAQAHVKTGDLKTALKDARDMIKAVPTSSKGYLAIGTICQLMNEESADKTENGGTALSKYDETALSIYERGLKYVKPGTDDRRQEMELKMARLYEKKFPMKKADPFKTVPAELAMQILLLLDYPTRVRCLGVSTEWKTFLEGIPEIWTNLDLSTTKRAITKTRLQAFIKRSIKDGTVILEKATVKIFSTGFGQPIDTIVRRCPNLSYLAVGSNFQGGQADASLIKSVPLAQNLKTLIIARSSEINLFTVIRLLRGCKTICEAEFLSVMMPPPRQIFEPYHWGGEHLPCLKSLTLNSRAKQLIGDVSWDELKLDELIKITPNLKVARIQGWACPTRHTLRMPDFSLWTNLTVLSFRDTVMPRFPRFPKSITCIDLKQSGPGGGLDKYSFQDLNDLLFTPHTTAAWQAGEQGLSNPKLYELPNLEEVYVNAGVTEELLSFLLRASICSGTLRILDVGGRDHEPKSYDRCESLTCLGLANSWRWSDEDVLEMVKLYPNLKELDLSKTKVTGYALKKITNREEGPLDKIILKECKEVFPDAFEYLESKGTLVCRW